MADPVVPTSNATNPLINVVNREGWTNATVFTNTIPSGGDAANPIRTNVGFGFGQSPAIDSFNNAFTDNAQQDEVEGKDQSKVDMMKTPSFSSEKIKQDPWTHYVVHPLTSGESQRDFKVEDRQHLGRQLNKEGIRNDTWGMQHEAEIFRFASQVKQDLVVASREQVENNEKETVRDV